MKLLFLAAYLFSSSVIGIAQTDKAGFSKAQKTLKKTLIADAPYVNSVKVEGCQLSLKSGSSSFWSPVPPVYAGRTGYFNDESSFSNGSEQLVFERRWDHYVLDMSLLDASKIAVEPVSKTLSRIIIVDGPKSVIIAKKPNEMREKYMAGTYVVVIKSKSTDKTVKAFTELAGMCANRK